MYFELKDRWEEGSNYGYYFIPDKEWEKFKKWFEKEWKLKRDFMTLHKEIERIGGKELDVETLST